MAQILPVYPAHSEFEPVPTEECFSMWEIGDGGELKYGFGRAGRGTSMPYRADSPSRASGRNGPVKIVAETGAGTSR
jgi:hypothetical protein